MSKICDTCETAIHCAKYGCIPERIGSKPAQEFVCSTGLCHYKAQPPWVGLTNEEITALLGPFPKYSSEWNDSDFYRFARAIEAKLKEKNT